MALVVEADANNLGWILDYRQKLKVNSRVISRHRLHQCIQLGQCVRREYRFEVGVTATQSGPDIDNAAVPDSTLGYLAIYVEGQ